DPLTPEQRRLCMSRIKGKDTVPELLVRKPLFALGYRYRLHAKDLPGKPDLVFPKYGAVIFVHGCFWHGHDCHLFKWPSTRPDFWHRKIERNRQRDILSESLLTESGWRVLNVWECAIKGKSRRPLEDVIEEIHHWLSSDQLNSDIRGRYDTD
ncbi:unnamed protein product, partial [Ectocarpus sp. 12 AP-2014]